MRTSALFLVSISLFFHSLVHACDEPAATIVAVNGRVVFYPSEESNGAPQALKPQDTLCHGYQIEVGSNSRAAIYLSNNTFVRLDENTVMNFPVQDVDAGFWVELKQGVSHYISRITKRFIVKTPYANAAVDGTEFLVAVEGQSSLVNVIEGQVTVSRDQSERQLALQKGQGASVSKQGRYEEFQIRATAAVDWALYFPPVIAVSELQSDQYQTKLDKAVSYLNDNRADLAIQELMALPENDSAISVALAAAYLASGDSAAALDRLQREESAQSYALQSIIAATTNQPQLALKLAKQSEGFSNTSLPALLALSYAQQASLDFGAALDAAQDASRLHSGSAVAWARLAEVLVALGDIRGAAKAISHAVTIEPDTPYVMTQSGFIDLFNHQYQNAKRSFQKALMQDPENPQTHLGLGLANLRQGELESGRKQLEFAVSLDPARSVLRSYLGRAYFEEKRDEEASVQWELAKQMDPEDPTPYFYDGVLKLYWNDPIAAVTSLEQAQRLNDNRNLYRSETLLQSDSASRSADLARAYDQAGFKRGAFLSGSKALAQDPSSAGGHRLLADTYRGDSRYDDARASELLQSQLWQPLTAFPQQPQFKETSLLVVEGMGPQQPGFNEYHSLYTHDGLYGAVNLYGGGDDSWGEDIVGSVLAGPLAFSLGNYYFESEGWGENTDQEQKVNEAFVQYEIGHGINLQYEYRKTKWDYGYLSPVFAQSLDAEIQRYEERTSNRAAITFNDGQALSWLVSLQDVDWDNAEQDLNLEGNGSRENNDSRIYDIQAVYRFSSSSFLFGAKYSESDQAVSQVSAFNLNFAFPPGTVFTSETFRSRVEEVFSSNLYGYYSWDIKPNLELNIGLSYVHDSITGLLSDDVLESFSPALVPPSFYPGEDKNIGEKIDDIMPKVGLVYDLSLNTRFSVAAFEYKVQDGLNRKSIEPTLFSNFNQIYSDPMMTFSRNLGMSFDSGRESSRYGLTLMNRDMQVPSLNSNAQYTFADQTEDSIDLYFYKPLGTNATFSTGANWVGTDFDAGATSVLGLKDIERYRVPIEVSLFDGYGSSVVFNQSYFHQDLGGVGEGADRSESSWVTSIHYRYRLKMVRGDIGCGIYNLLDEQSVFIGGSRDALAFYPARMWYANINLNL